MSIDFLKKQFDEVNEYCDQDNKRHLAISNPCFEIWLWMHFDEVENVTATTSGQLKKELHDKQSSEGFDGDYIPLISKAIERSKKVDASSTYFPEKNTTKVYKLIEELLSFSKK